MKIESYAKLRDLMNKSNDQQLINVAELNDPEQDRTLLYGFTCDRHTFHVYLKEGRIHRVIYKYGGKILNVASGVELAVNLMAPDKRAYPDACDEQFAYLMHYKDQHVSYTTFDPERENKQFHGKLIEELTPA